MATRARSATLSWCTSPIIRATPRSSSIWSQTRRGVRPWRRRAMRRNPPPSSSRPYLDPPVLLDRDEFAARLVQELEPAVGDAEARAVERETSGLNAFGDEGKGHQPLQRQPDAIALHRGMARTGIVNMRGLL